MSILPISVLFASAVLGGMLNAVAVGGSFFTFPALLLSGVPAIQANATSTVALWPGMLASVGTYRRDLPSQGRSLVGVLAGSSLTGGAIGALLLLKTSQAAFVVFIPYLLLVATLLFAFSSRITSWRSRYRRRNMEYSIVEAEISPTASHSILTLLRISLLQFLIAMYGGYFGGGLGILTLAHLSCIGMNDLRTMNALRTMLNACVNAVAILTFIAARMVAWPQALVMILGAIIGGYGGAFYVRKVDQKYLRLMVVVLGFGLAMYFFWQQK